MADVENGKLWLYRFDVQNDAEHPDGSGPLFREHHTWFVRATSRREATEKVFAALKPICEMKMIGQRAAREALCEDKKMDYKHREALRLVDGCLSDEKIAGMTGIPPEDVQALRALLRAPPPLPAPHPGAERGMNKPKRRQKGDSK